MKYPGLVAIPKRRLDEEGYSLVALKGLLTLTVENYNGSTTQHATHHETADTLYVPRNFMDFYDPESVPLNPARVFKSSGNIKPRDYQEQAIKVIAEQTRSKGGAILVGGCGTGKTVMGCFLASELKARTLVLVHKEFLMEQFKNTLTSAFEGISVGIWQRDEIPSPEHDVVITMVQSLCAREYDPALYEGFDLVITDEVHRFSAPLWSSVIERFGARYRIGLTATPERADGLQQVFLSHIGNIAHTVQGNLLTPMIYTIPLETSYPTRAYTIYDGSISTSTLITLLGDDAERTAKICDYVLKAARASRKVIVLTDRRGHAEEIRTIVSNELGDPYRVYLYLGGMDSDKREEAEQNCDVLVGTYSMAQEGLDIPRLDTLVFATPKTNVTQAVGRILRPSPNKKPPMVLDFVDGNIGILKGYHKKRLKQYAENDYPVRQINTK